MIGRSNISGIQPFPKWFACVVVFFACLFAGNASGQWDPPTNYYSSATGTGSTLKSQLTSIMSSGHIQRTYGNFRFSAAIHDQDPNNSSRILLAYNGASVPGTWDSGNTWNREHVWPQALQPGSASNSSQGNLGDPHALRPANPGINADRANKPFGFSNTTGSFGSLGQYWFPGDPCKGDIARSLFYSDTRWTSLGLSLTNNFPGNNQMGDLDSLIAWHYLDPPDEFEGRRNHTIYSSSFNPQYFTNNRNAYIDRPEFLWSIYVDQQNDSTITIDGGSLSGAGESTLTVDFGSAIVGAAAPTQQVTLTKSGMDGTYYSVEATEMAISETNGSHNAFRSNGTDSLTFDVSLDFDPAFPGFKTGLITIDNLDVTTQGGSGNGANDGDDIIGLIHKVLDHSNASFSGASDLNSQSIDLGEIPLGSMIPPTPFQIHNLASFFGEELTARLDLDSIALTPTDSSVTIETPLFENLLAKSSSELTLTGTADEIGSFTTEFEFQLSDEDLPGESGQTISLDVSYTVVQSVLLGDVNLDGVVNLLDIAPFIDLLSTGDYQAEADINQDGVLNLLDVAPLIALLSGG